MNTSTQIHDESDPLQNDSILRTESLPKNVSYGPDSVFLTQGGRHSSLRMKKSSQTTSSPKSRTVSFKGIKNKNQAKQAYGMQQITNQTFESMLNLTRLD